MEIGGYDVPDWPKMGPSLLIATALIVAIRTAKWSATIDARNSNTELDKEITFAASVAQRVLSALVSSQPSIFPNLTARRVRHPHLGNADRKMEGRTTRLFLFWSAFYILSRQSGN